MDQRRVRNHGRDRPARSARAPPCLLRIDRAARRRLSGEYLHGRRQHRYRRHALFAVAFVAAFAFTVRAYFVGLVVREGLIIPHLDAFVRDKNPSVIEVIRHAGDDDSSFEKQRAFKKQRALIVQKLLPPTRRHKLRQHYGNKAVLAFSP